jgi:hypothetical protein
MKEKVLNKGPLSNSKESEEKEIENSEEGICKVCNLFRKSKKMYILTGYICLIVPNWKEL